MHVLEVGLGVVREVLTVDLFVVLLPNLLYLVLFVLAHSFVPFVLLFVDRVEDAATRRWLVDLQEQPLHNVWEAQIDDALKEVVYQVFALVSELACADSELRDYVVDF